MDNLLGSKTGHVKSYRQNKGRIAGDGPSATNLVDHRAPNASRRSDLPPEETPPHLYHPNSGSQASSEVTHALQANSALKLGYPAAVQSLSNIVILARQKLELFFGWKPRIQQQSESGSNSSETREPTFYDLHLHEPLRLKKIVVVKNLAQVMGNICDITADFPALSSLESNKGFPKPNWRKQKLQHLCSAGGNVDEESVVQAYQLGAGAACSTIASGLIFALKSWKKVLLWQKKPVYNQGRAKADGFLIVPKLFDSEASHSEEESNGPDSQNISTGCESEKTTNGPEEKADASGTQSDDDSPDADMASWSDLTETDRENIRMITKHSLNHIALWEMKSLVAGSQKVMNAIVELEGDFDWITCESTGKSCGAFHTNSTGERSISGRKTGPDSDSTQNYWKEAELLDQTARKEAALLDQKSRKEAALLDRRESPSQEAKAIGKRKQREADVIQSTDNTAQVRDKLKARYMVHQVNFDN